MANFSNTSRPAYAWDGVNNQWVPIGVGPHTHAVADMTNAVSNLGGSNIVNTTTTSVPLTLTGAVSQTADLLDIKNSAGTVVASIDAQGNFAAQNTVYAGKNFVINGGMDIWQRGASIGIAASTAASTGTYAADRWQSSGTNASQAITISRQATSDSSNLPNIQYALRYQRNSGQTGTGYTGITQTIETANSVPLVGKIVTFSWWARAGANYSTGSNALFYQLKNGTGTDQNINGPFTGDTALLNNLVGLTTTWQRFSFSATVPTNATELGVAFIANFTGTAGANDYFEITGVQLEVGSVATPFSRAGGTLQGELAACQRYYWRTTANASNATTLMVGGWANSTSSIAQAYCAFPTAMRATPTASVNVTNLILWSAIGSGYSVALVGISGQNSSSLQGTLSLYVAGTPFTVNTPWNLLVTGGGTGYLDFSAEL
jgi:hypothetical protein